MLVWLGDAITDAMKLLYTISMVFPANQDLQIAGLLKRWCIAAASRWAEPVKSLSSCSLCHYGNVPYLVAPQSTYFNTRGEERQHYINCEHQRRECHESQRRRKRTDRWREEENYSEDHRKLVFVFVFICFLRLLFFLLLSELFNRLQPLGMWIMGVYITYLL